MRIRTRHSGQYIRPANNSVSANTRLLAAYAGPYPQEEYLLADAGEDNGEQWYYLEPVNNTDLCVDVGSTGAMEKMLRSAPHFSECSSASVRNRTGKIALRSSHMGTTAPS
jgi:hypothetical protein